MIWPFNKIRSDVKEQKHNAQFTNNKQAQKCDIVIGFDFGTSCTKVIIQSPFVYSGQAYAVPFTDVAHSSSPYLLPSIIYLDQKGEFHFGNSDGSGLYRDIKFHLVKQDSKVSPVNGKGEAIEAEILAVAFLALCLRRARHWFLENKTELYGKYRLEWHFNLGLPSADYADISLAESYKYISQSAWCLSVNSEKVTVESTKSVINTIKTTDKVQSSIEAEVNVIPEVAAEVVGYARSHMRDEGLHILVDIGASTLDVCSFILRESQGDDHYDILKADVRRLGTMALYEQRVEDIRKTLETHVYDLWNKCDPINPIPDSHDKYLPDPEIMKNSFQDSNDKYEDKCRRMLWETIIALKTCRDPRSPRWKNKIPVFLCGGGSAMEFYSKTIHRLSGDIADFYKGCGGLQKSTLPKPGQLDADIIEDNYHRLAVAWGLSYPEFNIGKITRPSDIEDVPRYEKIQEREEPWER